MHYYGNIFECYCILMVGRIVKGQKNGLSFLGNQYTNSQTQCAQQQTLYGYSIWSRLDGKCIFKKIFNLICVKIFPIFKMKGKSH